MGIGTLGGLFMGGLAALLMGWFGRSFRDPVEIERATGITAQRLGADVPLMISSASPRTILVLPIGEGAQASVVAERLAHTAAARAMRANILDLSSRVNGNGNGANGAESASALIQRLESEGGMLIVQLPGISGDATVAALAEGRTVVLVAPPGPVDRARLGSALDMLRRLNVPCAGVVLSEPLRRGIRA
jgi:hypothetical protein